MELRLILMICLLFSGSAFAEKVVVIVNKANSDAVNQAVVKAIYEDLTTTWGNGNRIVSYDLPVKKAEREVFSQKVLGKSASSAAKDLANRKITNTAQNPPKTKKDILVVSAVAKNADAIGYVGESVIAGKDVKVVMTIE